ncbi:MAG: DUF1801 domain-containing protein [Bacteroidetes bacterium]|nr:MAG: DUF1801 domain-containing protein [Bacteroidota bacterium]
MTIESISPENYIAQLPEDRQEAITALRQVILDNLPAGFEETISYNAIAYVVPKSLYPNGYHCDTTQPLPFLSLASQKNFIALYHVAMYADADLLAWFQQEYPKHSKLKLDMGKSCIRFKNLKQIPFALIGELAQKMTVQQWIEVYERVLKK